MNLSIPGKIKKISKNPGVYIFKNKNGNIIYVGKAANLRGRVSSYFQNFKGFDPSRPKQLQGVKSLLYSRPIEMMIHEVADIKTIETESVLEALILESNLIKKYQPKYNVKDKDDKSFSYFAITKEEWQRVVIVRGAELSSKIFNNQFPISKQIPKTNDQDFKKIHNTSYKIHYTKIYGPYTSKKQMEIALKIMRKIFPFHSSAQKTEKGCLDYQIGLCPGPYAGEISRADYLKNIRGIRMILEGKKKSLVRKLEKEMKEYADKEEFEKAQEVKHKIFALNHIHDVALISKDDELRVRSYELRDLRIEAYDISNISGQYAVGSMAVFENNEPNKSQYRKFKIKTVRGIDDVGAMREVLLRRFRNDWPLPDLILLDGGRGHLNMGVEVLKSLDLNIPIAAVAKGKNRKNLELRISNLELELRIKNIVGNKNMLKQIMNEAHRFAIGYHRKLRGRSLTGGK